MVKKKLGKLDWHRRQLSNSYTQGGLFLGFILDLLFKSRVTGVLSTLLLILLPLIIAAVLSYAARDGYDLAKNNH